MSLLNNVFGFPKIGVQRSYNWDCILPDVWGAGILGIAVSKFCQSVKVGNYNIDDIAEMKTGAFKKFFAGNMNIQNPTMTFIAPVPDIVSNYFHTWKKKIIDEDGYYHKASDYKKRIYVVLYDRTGIPVNMLTLVGAFPKSFPSWNLNYEGQELVKYEIEFKIDRLKTGLNAFSSFGGDAVKAIGETVKAVGKLF